jgi:hypothetical protein
MQGLYPHKEVSPQATRLVLAKLVLVMDHIVVKVATAREVLSDDVVIGFGFEEVDDADDLRNLSCFLEGEHL